MPTASLTTFIKKANHTARHFGFVPLDTLSTPSTAQRSRTAQKARTNERRLDAVHGALTAGISTYVARALYNQKPALFFSFETLSRTHETAFNLHIVGVRKSIAEALLIQTLRSLFTDLGYQHHSLRINSLGDQDSVTRYLRELTTYFRKRLEVLPPPARELMKQDVLSTFLYLSEIGHELAEKSPTPFEYLSDASRRHFREIIEHLDMTETPYDIDPRFLGHHHCYGDTIFSFELRDAYGVALTDEPFTIRGGRLDAFTRHILHTDLPATGAVVIMHGKKKDVIRVPQPRRTDTPVLFLVQLGFAPKVKSLMLLETLKRAGIPIYQALVSDSLSEQLRQAEAAQVPFSLILGQKEFVENTIIVRDMRSRSQQSISFDTLIPHLRRILKR